MSPYTALVSRLIFPLHEGIKRHDTVFVRKAMDRSQWLSADELASLQLDRLRHLLVDIGRSVPYYRRVFNERAFEPERIESIDDLQRLPFLDKSQIRANVEDLKSSHAHGLARFNTGGSSGEPLIFFIGKERVSHDVAAKWRATRWWDVDIGDREMVVWGSPIEVGAQDRVRMMRDAVMRTELLPAFDMSEDRLDAFVARIRQRRPKMLFGYPSAISLIGDHARARGVRLDNLGIKVVFVTSERLYDHQRRLISEVFGCPVANGYGGRDAGFIAHECPKGGMHITAEDIIVEIVDDAGRNVEPGQSGEIVVTHLATRDFPFVRYRTGDMGALSSKVCQCGRGLPMLERIEGRSTDFVLAADGTRMHGLSLIYILRDIDKLKAFKIIQESRDSTRVLVIREQGFDERGGTSAIVSGFRRRLGDSVDVRVEYVEDIPPEKSGKFRYVISHAV